MKKLLLGGVSRVASGAVEEYFGVDLEGGSAFVLGKVRSALDRGNSVSFESSTEGYLLIPDVSGVNVIETGFEFVGGKQVRSGRRLNGAVWDLGRVIKWLGAVLGVMDGDELDTLQLKVYRSEEEILYSPEGKGARGWREFVKEGKNKWVSAI